MNARKLHLFEEMPYSIVDFIMPRRYFEMIPKGWIARASMRSLSATIPGSAIWWATRR